MSEEVSRLLLHNYHNCGQNNCCLSVCLVLVLPLFVHLFGNYTLVALILGQKADLGRLASLLGTTAPAFSTGAASEASDLTASAVGMTDARLQRAIKHR